MSTVYRSQVHCLPFSLSVEIDRSVGATVMVGDQMMVRLPHGTMVPFEGAWHYDQRDADLSVLPDLEKCLARTQALIDYIKRPLPAEAAAESSAAGRAQAVVAT